MNKICRGTDLALYLNSINSNRQIIKLDGGLIKNIKAVVYIADGSNYHHTPEENIITVEGKDKFKCNQIILRKDDLDNLDRGQLALDLTVTFASNTANTENGYTLKEHILTNVFLID